MTAKPLRQSGAKKKAAAASETSESIAEQTAAFLKSGKRVEVLESGISKQSVLKSVPLGNPRRDG